MNKASINLDYKKGYGQNYANLRKKDYNNEKDYSIRELSKIIGLSPTSISFIETEQREPTIEQVKIYKKQFGVSLDYLTGETKVIRTEYRDICDFTVLNEDVIMNLRSWGSNGVGVDLLNKIMLDLPTVCEISAKYQKQIDEYLMQISELKQEIETGDKSQKEKAAIYQQIDKLVEFVSFCDWKRKNIVTETILKSL